MRKCLIIMVLCLMATSAFATNYTWNGTNYPTAGAWSDTTKWAGTVKPVSTGVYEKAMFYRANTYVVINSLVAAPAQVSIAGGSTEATAAKMDIVAGGDISLADFRVGEQGATGTAGFMWGVVNQSGGRVNMLAASSAAGSVRKDLVIGRCGGSAGQTGSGHYTISGGTLTYDSSITYNTAGLMVGACVNGSVAGAAPSVGTFTVVGNSASITMSKLCVGTDGVAPITGTGTMEFQVQNGAVSKIALTNSGAGNSSILLGGVANLVVSMTGTVPTQDILLIENQGNTAAVTGTFTGLAEGAAMVIGGNTYNLTYLFDGATGTRGTGNDIALLVPEPMTIALLGFGLLAIRRNKK